MVCDAAGVVGGKITCLLVEGIGDKVLSFRFGVGVSGGFILMFRIATSSAVFEGPGSIVGASRCFLIDSRVGRSRSGFLGDRRGVCGAEG